SGLRDHAIHDAGLSEFISAAQVSEFPHGHEAEAWVEVAPNRKDEGSRWITLARVPPYKLGSCQTGSRYGYAALLEIIVTVLSAFTATLLNDELNPGLSKVHPHGFVDSLAESPRVTVKS
ncbi:MAG: hypothetical protein QXS61_05325, partial [Candidatus Korarchaeum sp.]